MALRGSWQRLSLAGVPPEAALSPCPAGAHVSGGPWPRRGRRPPGCVAVCRGQVLAHRVRTGSGSHAGGCSLEAPLEPRRGVYEDPAFPLSFSKVSL